MNLTPVTSSTIDAIGYDPDAQTMHVAFLSGGTYEYLDVDPETHQALVEAPSVGSHFHKHVRPKFEGRKL